MAGCCCWSTSEARFAPFAVWSEFSEPLFVRFMADNLTREPLDYLPGVGFEIDEIERSKWGIVERLRAHKPR